MGGKDSIASVIRSSTVSMVAPEVAGHRADERAEGHGDEHGGHAHGERDASGVQQPAQDVATQLVGTEHMPLGQGRGELVPHLDLDRVGQTQTAREARAEQEEGDHDHAAHGGTMAGEARQDGRLLSRQAHPRIDRRVDEIGERGCPPSPSAPSA